jgi:pSer/pThr/pTyr-binding forkhead associated (FHA) protein
LKVTDLNSSNGTYINGSRVEQGIARPGDEVRFDEQRFIVVGPTRTARDFDADDDRTILREDSAELTQLAASPVDESLDTLALSRPSPAEKPAEPPQSASCEFVPEAGDTDCDSVSKGGEGQAEAENPARLAVQGEKGDATDGGPEFAKPVEIANDALTQVMIRSRDEDETVLFKRSEADVETRLFQRTDVPPPEAPIKRESTPESSPKAGWLAGLLVFLLFSALAGAIFFWRTTQ